MKKFALIVPIFLAIPSFANGKIIVGEACNESECIPFEMEYTEPTTKFEMLEAPKKTGNNKNRFLEVVAVMTGDAVESVRGVLEGISDTVVAAGYHEFVGQLSGPAGTVSVSYNFKSGAWSVSGSRGNGGGKKPKKQRN
jgi:hypothetical protein